MRVCVVLVLCGLLTAAGCSRSTGRADPRPEPAAVVLTATPPRADAGHVEDCPHVTSARTEGRLADGDLDELSGLVASRTQPGVLWVHNDSGDSARVFAMTLDGRVRAEVKLRHADADDYEDIALGPGPSPDVDYLYIADTGDNRARRKSVRIYRIEEPQLAPSGERQKLERDAFTIRVVYEDGPRDAETLWVDPLRQDLYLVQKGPLFASEAPVGVYRLAAEALRTGQVTARRVATIPLGPATGGDMQRDGSALAIRNYWTALSWKRVPGESVASALARPPCVLPLADRGQQGESFGYTADGTGYLTISEGPGAPIYHYRLAPRE